MMIIHGQEVSRSVKIVIFWLMGLISVPHR